MYIPIAVDTELLSESKTWLRIKRGSDELDEEIKQTIEACIRDLTTAGVVCNEIDSLIKQAIKLYLKSQYGYDEDAGTYLDRYECLKAKLAVANEYSEDGDLF